MVETVYQAGDGSIFRTKEAAETYEYVSAHRVEWGNKLSSFGLDASGVSVVLQYAVEIYLMLDDVLYPIRMTRDVEADKG